MTVPRDRNGNPDWVRARAERALALEAEYQQLRERVAALEASLTAIRDRLRTLEHQTANRFP